MRKLKIFFSLVLFFFLSEVNAQPSGEIEWKFKSVLFTDSAGKKIVEEVVMSNDKVLGIPMSAQLKFTGETYSLATPCNSCGGKFTGENGKLKHEGGGCTEIYCEDYGRREWQDLLLKCFNETYFIDKGVDFLKLYFKDNVKKGIVVFYK